MIQNILILLTIRLMISFILKGYCNEVVYSKTPVLVIGSYPCNVIAAKRLTALKTRISEVT